MAKLLKISLGVLLIIMALATVVSGINFLIHGTFMGLTPMRGTPPLFLFGSSIAIAMYLGMLGAFLIFPFIYHDKNEDKEDREEYEEEEQEEEEEEQEE